MLSQKEMAALLGVPERTLQAYEAGMVPRPERRRAILAWLAEAEAEEGAAA